jgi:hypothetical protein
VNVCPELHVESSIRQLFDVHGEQLQLDYTASAAFAPPLLSSITFLSSTEQYALGSMLL